MTVVSQTIPLHGMQLIEASAGTGKTYTISTLFVRMLLERPADIEQILVVTYTRAATAELQDRIRRRLVEALDAWRADQAPIDISLRALWETRSSPERKQDITRLRIALGNYDRAAIHTIHGFCQRVLNEHAFHSDAPLAPDLLMTERPLLQEVVNDFWARHTYQAPGFLLDELKVGTTLEGLLRLAQDTLHQRDAKLIPDRPAVSALPDPEPFRVAKRALAEAWALHGQTALKTIATTPGINQRSYSASTVEAKWGDEIAKYLGSPSVMVPAEVRKLGTSALAESMNANAGAPPRLMISATVDALLPLADALSNAIDQWKLLLRLDLVHEVRAEVDRRKREHEQLAFDDLLRQVRSAVEGPHGRTLIAKLRANYPVALVDEFQDTDPVQYAIFTAMYGRDMDRGGLFLIGDPKQAIYRFRGADVFAYMDAVRAVGGEPHRLRDNWRSDPSLIHAINAVFAQSPRPFVYEAIGFSPATPAQKAADRLAGDVRFTKALSVIVPTHDEKVPNSDAVAHAAHQTALHIGHTLASDLTLEGRPVEPRDFAVLCRTNAQAVAVQEQLRALRIPTARDGDSSVFDTSSARDLDRLLSGVAQPDEPSLLRVALSTSLIGLDAGALLELDNEEDSSAWEHWVARFRSWHATWLDRGFMPMLHRLLSEAGVHARLLSLVDGERRLTDLLHVAELMQRQSADRHTGPLSLVQWLRTLREDDEARNEVDEAQIRLESDAHAVKLTTVHRSKGLEYPIVYCPFLWHPGPGSNRRQVVVFHGDATAESLTIDVSASPSDEHKRLSSEESLAEELRLAYVALTRARHRCVVLWCNATNSDNAALHYLLAGPPTDDTPSGKKKKDKSAGPIAMRSALETLARAHAKHIDLEVPLESTPPVYGDRATRPLLRSSREFTRRLPPGLRITSFSRLVERGARLGLEAEEGHDHDGATQLPSPAESSSVRVDSSTGTALIALADVRAGADVGLLVHDVLEHSDFSVATRDQLETRLRESAPLHGVDEATAALLLPALANALDARLGGDALAFSLSDLPTDTRLPELEFMFPVSRAFHANSLADAIARHQPTLVPPAYLIRLRALGFQAFDGFLRGYIDLCFVQDGRYYVLDYKTNHLGRHVDDYRGSHLQGAMADHHYYVQALVYSAALHLHLRRRLPNYDYAQHFGGFLYGFVRGMSGSHPPGTGVLHGLPTPDLMNALCELLGGQRR